MKDKKRNPKSSGSVNRRDILSSLIGAAGVTALSGCTEGMGNPNIGEIQNALAGTGDHLLWADSMNELRTLVGTADDRVAVLTGYFTDGDGGGGVFVWCPSSNAPDDEGIVIKPNNIQGIGRWQRLVSDWGLNVRWFGACSQTCECDECTDDTAAINATILWASNGRHGTRVRFPAGTFHVTSSIKLTGSGPMVEICGAGMTASTIVMTQQPKNNPPQFFDLIGDETYSLDYHPVMYNANPVSYLSIHDLMIDGGGLDVYGLRLQENFYGNHYNVMIQNTKQHAYLNIRGQAVNHQRFICYGCEKGALLYNCTSIDFTNCGFQELGSTTGDASSYSLEIRQPRGSNKGGTTLRGIWFEEGPPAQRRQKGYFALSGRNNIADYIFCANVDDQTLIGHFFGDDLASGSAFEKTIDGLTMTCQAARSNQIRNLNTTGGGAGVRFEPETRGNRLTGFFNAGMIDDRGNDNSIDVAGSGIDYEKITSQFQVRRDPTNVHPRDYIFEVAPHYGQHGKVNINSRFRVLRDPYAEENFSVEVDPHDGTYGKVKIRSHLQVANDPSSDENCSFRVDPNEGEHGRVKVQTQFQVTKDPYSENWNYALKVDPDENEIFFLGNPGNKMRLRYGQLVLESASNMFFIPKGSMQLLLKEEQGNNVYIAGQDTGTSNWKYGHLKLGKHHLWVDSQGRLRISHQQPTSDFDGEVVGTQT